jgi:hypothetical protein
MNRRWHSMAPPEQAATVIIVCFVVTLPMIFLWPTVGMFFAAVTMALSLMFVMAGVAGICMAAVSVAALLGKIWTR